MKIVCIGGGPAGLYFGLLMKKLHPAHDITVVERNQPYDTFGWGVVFSDATMEDMRQWDPDTAAEIEQAFNHWDDIELVFKGRYIRSGGHGFVGIGRKKLLNILQARCEALGVEARLRDAKSNSDPDFPDADLIIASDGINSQIRTQVRRDFKPDLVTRPNRYIWLGTHKLYDAFTFDFRKTEHGWFQAHIYKFDDKTSTFIVETTEARVAGAWPRQARRRSSRSAFARQLFAEHLDGHKLMTQCAPPARLGLAELPARDLRAMDAFQRPLACGADGRRGAHRPFRHRLGHQAGDRGRDRAGAPVQGPRPRPGGDPGGAAAHTRRCAASMCSPPERGPQRDGMVRGGRPSLCRHAAARAVHVLDADAQPAHQPREPAPARQGLARRLRALVRAPVGAERSPTTRRRRRRCSRPTRCAA